MRRAIGQAERHPLLLCKLVTLSESFQRNLVIKFRDTRISKVWNDMKALPYASIDWCRNAQTVLSSSVSSIAHLDILYRL